MRQQDLLHRLFFARSNAKGNLCPPGLLYERAHELVHGHGFERGAVGKEGHEVRGLLGAVVGGEGGLGFLGEDGDAPPEAGKLRRGGII